jgi:membrane protease YdiL (CAAX protease family)
MNQKNNVLVFILITFGFSWLSWVPEALIAQNIWGAPDVVSRFVDMNLGAWGPLVGALVTTFIYQRFAGLKELFKRGVMVRLGKWWWVTLLIFPVLIGGSLGLALLLGNPTPAFPAVAEAAESGAPLPVFLLIAFVMVFFTTGPLQEEFGWRGYVVEHLRNLFFSNRQEPYYTNPAWGLMLTTLLVGIILAWIYINTKGSIFAAMLGHAMFNWSNYVFPALDVDAAGLILFGLYFAVVVYIVWQYGRRTLTKA